MRLVLSRKGFDSACGGVPSPVLPDGTVRPLPIPYRTGSRTYKELGGPAPIAAELIADLARGRRTPWSRHEPITPDTPTHLDPDLDPHVVPRPPHWRAAFGQVNAAQTHLRNNGVCAGDLFLFFGLFRPAERAAGRWRFVPGLPAVHAVWGWLQVGDVYPATPRGPVPPGLETHEHFRADLGAGSTVYAAADRLTLGAPVRGVPGAGVVRRLRPELVLTAVGASPSRWRLPAWFAPASNRKPLSYHRDHDRWTPDGDGVRLHTVSQGQEFVLHLDDYPEAVPWLRTLLAPQAPRAADRAHA